MKFDVYAGNGNYVNTIEVESEEEQEEANSSQEADFHFTR